MAFPVDVSVFVHPSALRSAHMASADIQEIFGSHFELPELGPLGGSGLASARDFEHPVAHFDIDQTPWESKSIRHPSAHRLEAYVVCQSSTRWEANILPASRTIRRSMLLLGTESESNDQNCSCMFMAVLIIRTSAMYRTNMTWTCSPLSGLSARITSTHRFLRS